MSGTPAAELGTKRKYSVGYFSSYDRGLKCLLDMWTEIKQKVPEATLDIYYGWNMFDAVHRQNPDMMRWKWNMIKQIHELEGVAEHGRVSHEELGKVMKQIKVWAYPTEFTEIHCITALKAQEAGCIPVTTRVGALAETVAAKKFMVNATDIYTNQEAQDEFVSKVCEALTTDWKQTVTVPQRYWEDVAKVWHKALS